MVACNLKYSKGYYKNLSESVYRYIWQLGFTATFLDVMDISSAYSMGGEIADED